MLQPTPEIFYLLLAKRASDVYTDVVLAVSKFNRTPVSYPINSVGK